MFQTHICGLFGQYFDLPRTVREHEEGQLGFEREETRQVWSVDAVVMVFGVGYRLRGGWEIAYHRKVEVRVVGTRK